MSDVQIVYGPTVEVPDGPLYHVTLSSGLIVTSPGGFGESVAEAWPSPDELEPTDSDQPLVQA